MDISQVNWGKWWKFTLSLPYKLMFVMSTPWNCSSCEYPPHA